jgi:hypothetical protein
MADLEFPTFAKDRGPGFWLRPSNLWAARRIARMDGSNAWRRAFTGTANPGRDRSIPFSALLAPRPDGGPPHLPGSPASPDFRFLILADTGEGDRSQFGLLPLIRFMRADFMLIVGDVANPAGRMHDFEEGFFQPYAGLRMPIWAVPGNHDYYSAACGREFFDVFCTRKLAKRWEEAALRLVPQPGTYWELKQPGAGVGLAVIALDTGHSGDLDGEAFASRGGPDRDQHDWLERRLVEADREDLAVIALFHIPALGKMSGPTRGSGVHLRGLHQTLLGHRCVKLIACGHEHNYQRYTPDVFAAFAAADEAVAWSPACRPDFLIAGGGGSGLHSTDFNGPFPLRQAEGLFPTAQQWRDYATIAERAVAKLPLERGPAGVLTRVFPRDIRSDDDAARYLCFLVVDVVVNPGPGAPRAIVTPVWLEDLARLFPGPGTVRIADPTAVPAAAQVLPCLKTPIAL